MAEIRDRYPAGPGGKTKHVPHSWLDFFSAICWLEIRRHYTQYHYSIKVITWASRAGGAAAAFNRVSFHWNAQVLYSILSCCECLTSMTWLPFLFCGRARCRATRSVLSSPHHRGEFPGRVSDGAASLRWCCPAVRCLQSLVYFRYLDLLTFPEFQKKNKIKK